MTENQNEVPAEIAALSYEEARDQLTELVSNLEAGNVTLEESLDIFEKGQHLAAHCTALLGQAQEQVVKATGHNVADAAALTDDAASTASFDEAE